MIVSNSRVFLYQNYPDKIFHSIIAKILACCCNWLTAMHNLSVEEMLKYPLEWKLHKKVAIIQVWWHLSPYNKHVVDINVIKKCYHIITMCFKIKWNYNMSSIYLDTAEDTGLYEILKSITDKVLSYWRAGETF